MTRTGRRGSFRLVPREFDRVALLTVRQNYCNLNAFFARLQWGWDFRAISLDRSLPPRIDARTRHELDNETRELNWAAVGSIIGHYWLRTRSLPERLVRSFGLIRNPV